MTNDAAHDQQPTLRTLGRVHVERVLSFLFGVRPARVGAELGSLEITCTGRPTTSAARLLRDRRVIPLFQSVHSVPGEPIALAEGTGHSLIARDGEKLRYGFDIWQEVGASLAGIRYAGTANENLAEVAARPFVDWQIGVIADWMEMHRGFERRSLPWPGGARFSLGLSHDVDRIRKTFQFLTHPPRHLLAGRVRSAVGSAIPDPEAYWGFPVIRRLEEARKVRSTFFVLPGESDAAGASVREKILLSGISRLDSDELVSEVREMYHDGWEIGLHSSNAARASPVQLAREKRTLEKLIDGAVPGVRQHFLADDIAGLWPAEAQSGFAYDSSMGFSDRIGFRAATSFPYEVSMPGLWELPFEVMDGALPADVEDAWRLCLAMLEEVEEVQGAFVVLWHQRFFSRRDFPGSADVYCRLIDEAKRRGAWVASCGEIVHEWRRLSGLAG